MTIARITEPDLPVHLQSWGNANSGLWLLEFERQKAGAPIR